jgi:Lar family restriction alleviation protein
MTMTDELLPCPFCGDQGVLTFTKAAGMEWATVDCFNEACGAIGPAPATEAEAIAAWNTRASEPPEQGEVTDADREAARALALSMFDGDFRPEAIRDTFITAFANHRALGIAQGRKEAEAEIVAWLLTSPPVIGLSQMAAWNTAAHIEREEYKEPKP